MWSKVIKKSSFLPLRPFWKKTTTISVIYHIFSLAQINFCHLMYPCTFYKFWRVYQWKIQTFCWLDECERIYQSLCFLVHNLHPIDPSSLWSYISKRRLQKYWIVRNFNWWSWWAWTATIYIHMELLRGMRIWIVDVLDTYCLLL